MNSQNNFRPKFYGIIAIMLLTPLTHLLTRIKFHKHPNYKIISYSNSVSASLKRRTKLLLTKFIKFNGQLYFSPAVPAYPSKAFDNMLAAGGLNYSMAGTSYKINTDSVFLAVSGICTFDCRHCYEKHNINNGNNIPISIWKETIDSIQSMGAGIIILTGGEPLLVFDNIIELLSAGNKQLSDFHLHTSGYTLTKQKAQALKKAGLKAAAVGLDYHIRQQQDMIRGAGSFDIAVNALKMFNEAGIMTYVNLCATRELIRSGRLYEYYSFVKSLNVSIIQLLEPRPCGALSKSYRSESLNDNDRATLLRFTVDGNTKMNYRKYPLIYYVAHIEDAGQLGCMMGGLSHFSIDSHGNVNPCVFMPVSFGNIMEQDIKTIYHKMREAIPRPVTSGCPSLRFADNFKNHLPLHYDSIKDKWDDAIGNLL